MFEFFEGLIEDLGIKLVSNFTDKLICFIKNVKEKEWIKSLSFWYSKMKTQKIIKITKNMIQ